MDLEVFDEEKKRVKFNSLFFVYIVCNLIAKCFVYKTVFFTIHFYNALPHG